MRRTTLPILVTRPRQRRTIEIILVCPCARYLVRLQIRPPLRPSKLLFPQFHMHFPSDRFETLQTFHLLYKYLRVGVDFLKQLFDVVMTLAVLYLIPASLATCLIDLTWNYAKILPSSEVLSNLQLWYFFDNFSPLSILATFGNFWINWHNELTFIILVFEQLTSV